MHAAVQVDLGANNKGVQSGGDVHQCPKNPSQRECGLASLEQNPCVCLRRLLRYLYLGVEFHIQLALKQ